MVRLKRGMTQMQFERVSTVANYIQEEFLINWRVKQGIEKAQEILEHAGHVGSIVDTYVYNEIHGLPNDLSGVEEQYKKEVDCCLAGWDAFKIAHPEFIEKAVRFKDNMQIDLVDDDIGLTGHADFIFDDEVPDLKTSSGIKKAHRMQVAAYSRMVGKQLGYKIKRNSIVWLSKKEAGSFLYEVWEEPFISFWMNQFDLRLSAIREDGVYKDMVTKQKHKEILGI